MVRLIKLETKVRLLIWTAFQFVENLPVALDTHYNLTMDIFNVHVFPAITGMSPHQCRLVSHPVDIVGSRGCCRVLQRLRSHPVILRCSLLDRVDRRLILADWCGLRDVLGLLVRQVFSGWVACLLGLRVALLVAHVLGNRLVRDDHLI